MGFSSEHLIDLPMLTTGGTVVGCRRWENLEDQDVEQSESEPPVQYHSSALLLGRCSKDSMGQAGEKAKQRTDQTESISFTPQQATVEPVIGSIILGCESGIVHPKQDVDEKDCTVLEQLHFGASSGHTWSTTSGIGIMKDLQEFEAEVAKREELVGTCLQEFKPLVQHRDGVSGFSGDPSTSDSGLWGREGQDLMQADTGASSGHAIYTTAVLGTRTDREEFEVEIADRRNEELKPSDQQDDEYLGFNGGPSSSIVSFGKRRSERGVKELQFPDEKYARIATVNRNPNFCIKRNDKGKQVVDAVLDLPMLTTGGAVFGCRRWENLEDQDVEQSESEPPVQYHSSALLLGSCSKDSMGQAGEKAKQRTDQTESISFTPQHATVEPVIGSIILGCESGIVHPKQDVDEKDCTVLEQLHFGASSGHTWSTTSGVGIMKDLQEFEAEVAKREELVGTCLPEFKPLVQHRDGVSGFSGDPSTSNSGLWGKEGQDLMQADTGASSGHAIYTTAVLGTRTDREEFVEIADRRYEELKPSDQQDDEYLGFNGGPSSSIVSFGKRRSEGGVKELQFPDEKYARIATVNRNPNFCIKRNDKGKQVVDAVESDLSSKPEKNGNCAVVGRASVGFRGKLQRMEPDEGSSNYMEFKAIALPEELVEKILSMIPFPDILKTCLLNKSWHLNFSTRPEALAFQDQVKTVSSRWKHYCPIILNIEKEWLVGYDREYNRWQNMPLRFEREGLKNWFSTQKVRGAGSLMCGVYNGDNVFVTNIVTRTWKWLPSRPDMAYPKEIHVLPIGSEFYRVLLLTKNARDPTKVSCQLYDSRMESWTVKHSTVSTALLNSSSAYLDGVLYIMEYDPDDFNDVMKMLSYSVEDGIWKTIHHPFGSMLHEIETYELLVCQNHVLVVLHLHPTWWTTTNRSHNTVRNTLMVYKLDPVSLDIKEVARGPPEPVSASCTLFASDNDSIFFGNPQVVGSSVVELSLQSKEWRCLPPPTCADGSFKNKWATFAFQPGMNPFVSV